MCNSCLDASAGSRRRAAAVIVDDLVKRFGQTTALDGVSFEVQRGELFGFIGPDGAGKTTLFRILATLLVPDAGRAQVLGRDVVRALWALRERVGYMPGRFSLYPDLSVEENLRFFASVFGTTIEREHEQIAPIYTQLEPFKDRRAGALSGGMKQKLALCCALVHRPDILFLDEPTTGVDAVSRREFWDLLGRLKARGLTIVVSTPYMDEADRCDRVALMQRRPHAGDRHARRRSRASFDRPLLAVRAARPLPRAARAARVSAHAHASIRSAKSLHYTDARADVAAEQHRRRAAAITSTQRASPTSTSSRSAPTIEDSFMALHGRARRTAARRPA